MMSAYSIRLLPHDLFPGAEPSGGYGRPMLTGKPCRHPDIQFTPAAPSNLGDVTAEPQTIQSVQRKLITTGNGSYVAASQGHKETGTFVSAGNESACA
jgi:hypothetical protein